MYLDEMSVSPTQTCLHNHISFILWNGLATKKKLDTKTFEIVARALATTYLFLVKKETFDIIQNLQRPPTLKN
jgi:hypothetical protein